MTSNDKYMTGNVVSSDDLSDEDGEAIFGKPLWDAIKADRAKPAVTGPGYSYRVAAVDRETGTTTLEAVDE